MATGTAGASHTASPIVFGTALQQRNRSPDLTGKNTRQRGSVCLSYGWDAMGQEAKQVVWPQVTVIAGCLLGARPHSKHILQ